MQIAIQSHLNSARREAVLVDGRTTEARMAQRKWRFFKAFPGLPIEENMKADVSESFLPLSDDRVCTIEGVKFATLPVLVISKICAIAGQRPRRMKGATDAIDLVNSLDFMVTHNIRISGQMQSELFARETTFSWAQFWGVWGSLPESFNTDALKAAFLAVGITKVRWV